MPNYDVYTTRRLLLAIQGLQEAPNFLLDRYFPHNEADVFTTEKVLVEIRDGDRRLAPFVIPYSGGVPMSRIGQRMYEYMPPTVKPQRPITLDDVVKRGFGEALYGDNITPQQRAQLIAIRDLDELRDMVYRRMEYMASEVMRTNGCKMVDYDDNGATTIIDEIRFYDGDHNPAEMTFDTDWDDPTADIFANMAAMVQALSEAGLPAEDLVVSTDVADAIMNNEKVQKMLDNRRMNLGEAEPTITAPGAAIMCVLNVRGHKINVIAYDKTYKDDQGKTQPFMPSGSAIMTAPGAGRAVFGAVTQVEQSDGQMHSYAAPYVPKFTFNAENDVRNLTVTSRPLMVPNDVNPFIYAKVLSE